MGVGFTDGSGVCYVRFFRFVNMCSMVAGPVPPRLEFLWTYGELYLTVLGKMPD